MQTDFIFNEFDGEMLKKLQGFIPENIFDAHAHIYNLQHLSKGPEHIYNCYGDADAARFLKDQKVHYGDCNVRALFIPYPAVTLKDKNLRQDLNRWMVEQLESAPGCVCELYTAPGDTVDELESQLNHDRIKGFKCYHLTADCDGPTWQANIGQYLPDSAWIVADRHGLCITLHMVKEHSLSDPDNLSYIKEMTAKYPNAKLILAHCARGFASWQTIEAVRQLKGIPNIYYDLAAICDPATIFQVIRQAGYNKVMWGSDYPIDRNHTRPVNVGTSFTWLNNCDALQAQGFKSTMLTFESLFAFYQACLMLDAGSEVVEDIFYNNAMRLFGLVD